MFSRLDAWITRVAFHPPLIRLCQLTRQSQYAVHRYIWFAAATYVTYRDHDTAPWGFMVINWIWVGGLFIGAAMWPDHETESKRWFRFLFWLLMAISLGAVLFERVTPAAAFPYPVLALFAEYAATIKTVPPRRERDEVCKLKEQKA